MASHLNTKYLNTNYLKYTLLENTNYLRQRKITFLKHCRTCVETWHEGPESTTLKRLTPPGYRCIEAARPITPDAATNTVDFQNHGGLAFIHRDIIRFQKRILVESIDIRCYASTPDSQFMLGIYRPGSAPLTPTCFNDLSTVLEQLVSYSCPVVVCGDFHFDLRDDGNAVRLRDTLQSQGQHMRVVKHLIWSSPGARLMCSVCASED